MARLLGCLMAWGIVAAAWAEVPVQSPVGVKQVILIGWDGYGSAYVDWNEVPNLKRMKENGAWTLKTRCVLPSVSAINWCTILMGAGSELHGYRTWGSETPDIPSRVLTERGRFPDIFYVVHSQMPEAKTAFTYTWKTCDKFLDSEKLTYQQFFDNQYDASTKKFLEFLEHRPTLSFIYFSEPDNIGHKEGWGSEAYHKTVQQLDKHLGEILKYLEEKDWMKDTLVVFVSDHGGSEKGHGKDLLSHMETPFVLYGAGVKPGEIQDVVVNYDTAATIAWVLGLDRPQVWRGQPVTSAFEVSR
ncbi:MAG: alkaline phosphatase [Planctomycetia bacterium]|nr:alkaline phosphatase [Planctomycetia bacterium]